MPCPEPISVSGNSRFPLDPIYNKAVLASAPVAYWKLGEASGTVMNDSSGNAHHGTYIGAVTLAVDGILEDDYYSAEKCATFSGTAYGNVPYGSWMNTGAMTIEAWCRPTSVSGTQMIVERDSNASTISAGRVWNLLINSSHFPSFSTAIPSASMSPVFEPTVLTAGTVYYLVGTLNGAVASLYIDGKLVAQIEHAGSLLRPTSQGITIGNNPGGSFPFNGALEKIAFYNRALPASEIDKHWIASNPGGINPTLTATPTLTTASTAGTATPTAVGGSLANQGTFFIAPR